MDESARIVMCIGDIIIKREPDEEEEDEKYDATLHSESVNRKAGVDDSSSTFDKGNYSNSVIKRESIENDHGNWMNTCTSGNFPPGLYPAKNFPGQLNTQGTIKDQNYDVIRQLLAQRSNTLEKNRMTDTNKHHDNIEMSHDSSKGNNKDIQQYIASNHSNMEERGRNSNRQEINSSLKKTPITSLADVVYVKPLRVTQPGKNDEYNCIECGKMLNPPYHQHLWQCKSCSFASVCMISFKAHYNRCHNGSLGPLNKVNQPCIQDMSVDTTWLLCRNCKSFYTCNPKKMDDHLNKCANGNKNCIQSGKTDSTATTQTAPLNPVSELVTPLQNVHSQVNSLQASNSILHGMLNEGYSAYKILQKMLTEANRAESKDSSTAPVKIPAVNQNIDPKENPAVQKSEFPSQSYTPHQDISSDGQDSVRSTEPREKLTSIASYLNTTQRFTKVVNVLHQKPGLQSQKVPGVSKETAVPRLLLANNDKRTAVPRLLLANNDGRTAVSPHEDLTSENFPPHFKSENSVPTYLKPSITPGNSDVLSHLPQNPTQGMAPGYTLNHAPSTLNTVPGLSTEPSIVLLNGVPQYKLFTYNPAGIYQNTSPTSTVYSTATHQNTPNTFSQGQSLGPSETHLTSMSENNSLHSCMPQQLNTSREDSVQENMAASCSAQVKVESTDTSENIHFSAGPVKTERIPVPVDENVELEKDGTRGENNVGFGFRHVLQGFATPAGTANYQNINNQPVSIVKFVRQQNTLQMQGITTQTNINNSQQLLQGAALSQMIAPVLELKDGKVQLKLCLRQPNQMAGGLIQSQSNNFVSLPLNSVNERGQHQTKQSINQTSNLAEDSVLPSSQREQETNHMKRKTEDLLNTTETNHKKRKAEDLLNTTGQKRLQLVDVNKKIRVFGLMKKQAAAVTNRIKKTEDLPETGGQKKSDKFSDVNFKIRSLSNYESIPVLATGTLACRICPKEFWHLDSLLQHHEMELPEKRTDCGHNLYYLLDCHVCQSRKGIWARRGDWITCFCETCDRSFTSLRQFNHHVIVLHGEKKQCTFCKIDFTIKRDFKDHVCGRLKKLNQSYKMDKFAFCYQNDGSLLQKPAKRQKLNVLQDMIFTDEELIHTEKRNSNMSENVHNIITHTYGNCEVRSVNGCSRKVQKVNGSSDTNNGIISNNYEAECDNGTHNLAEGDNGTHNLAEGDNGTHNLAEGDNGTNNLAEVDNGTHNLAEGDSGTHNLAEVDNGTHYLAEGDNGTHNLAEVDNGTHYLAEGDSGTHNLAEVDNSTHNLAEGDNGTHYLAEYVNEDACDTVTADDSEATEYLLKDCNPIEQRDFKPTPGICDLLIVDTSKIKVRNVNSSDIITERFNNFVYESVDTSHTDIESASTSYTLSDSISNTEEKRVNIDSASEIVKTPIELIIDSNTLTDSIIKSETEAEIVTRINTEAEIVTRSNTEVEIFTNSNTEAEIVTRSNNEAEIVTNSNTEAEIVNRSNTQADIVNKRITEAEIVTNSNTEAEIINRRITEAEIVTNSNTEAEIVNRSNTQADIVNKRITEAEIVTNSNTEAEIINRRITEAEIVTNSNTEAEIVTNSNTEAEIVTNSNTEAEIVTDSNTEAEIVTNSNTEAEIVTRSDTEAEIFNRRITEAEIVNRRITEAEIVTTCNSNTEAEVVNRSNMEAEIVIRRITEAEIFTNRNTEAEIVNRRNTEEEIVNRRITEAEIVTNSDTVPESFNRNNTVPESFNRNNTVPESFNRSNNEIKIIFRRNTVPENFESRCTQNNEIQLHDSLVKDQVKKTNVNCLCSPCKVFFTSLSKLNAHVCYVHRKGLQCVICNTYFISYKDMCNHECARVFLQMKLNPLTRIVLHFGSEDKISESTEYGSDQWHIVVKDNPTTLEETKNKEIRVSCYCRKCKIGLISLSQLNDHIFNVHTKREECIFCKMDFKSTEEMGNHFCEKLNTKLKNNILTEITVCPIWDANTKNHKKGVEVITLPWLKMKVKTLRQLAQEKLDEKVMFKKRQFEKKTKEQKKVATNKISPKETQYVNRKSCPVCPLFFKAESNQSLYEHFYKKHQKDTKYCRFCQQAFLADNHECKKEEEESYMKRKENKNKIIEELVGEESIKLQKCPQCSYMKYFCKENIHNQACTKNACIPCKNCCECEGINCFYCGKIFHSESLTWRHVDQRHRSTKTGIFHCYLCNLSINTLEQLQLHVKNVHPLMDALTCQEIFRKRSKYRKCRQKKRSVEQLSADHEKQRKKYQEKHKDRYKCDVCQEKFTYFMMMKKHIANEHNGENFGCNDCNMWFKDKRTLKRHQMKEHLKGCVKEQSTCYVCNLKFRSDISLKRHKLKEHLIEDKHLSKSRENVACEQCGKIVTRRSMRLHLLVHREKEFMCEYCGEKFRRRDVMKQHRQIHLRKKNVVKSETSGYECLICGLILSTNGALKRHFSWKHSSAKFSIPCKTCGRLYASKPVLSIHMKLKHSHQPFYCEICNKRFYYNYMLKNHVKIVHENFKPFQCDICNFRCYMKSALVSHMKYNH
ncbi:uncharacterized protein LOC127709458 isoform X3 [Mytilus californianus]|uniref:uncharacterized protein LOC127709458 isoform X3 n=1 Tax=Mytilus californianus TaxID=6549 RepID=UPI0022475689|nr:uncharacterized protein LOC127709458 isoform X3 [Mytilus californianus]